MHVCECICRTKKPLLMTGLCAWEYEGRRDLEGEERVYVVVDVYLTCASASCEAIRPGIVAFIYVVLWEEQ